MTKKIWKTLVFVCFICSAPVIAGEVRGQDGAPGCDGGTDPAADGRFYTPDGVQCNPGPEDAKKILTQTK